MKHLSIILLFAITTSLFGQNQNRRDKINALKIAHITEQMDLTQSEAQKFWPIYNANETAESLLRQKLNKQRNAVKPEDLTENEAHAFLLEMQAITTERHKLKSKLLKDLLAILPAKKIISFYQAEKMFREKMVSEFKSRHKGRMHKN